MRIDRTEYIFHIPLFQLPNILGREALEEEVVLEAPARLDGGVGWRTELCTLEIIRSLTPQEIQNEHHS